VSTEQRRTEVITVRVTPAGKQAIADAAAREERDFSDMARLLWQRGVEASNKLTSNRAHGTVNSTFNPQPKGGKKA
jgi:hypothetical protein